MDFFMKNNMVMNFEDLGKRERFVSTEPNFEIVWHKSVFDAFTFLKPQKNPVHFVAHEFFDALPCFKFKV